MSKNRLYFSVKCRYCQAFLEELKKTPFASGFQFICVDPSPNRPALPSWLKSVPTLLAAGETAPRVGPGPVNNWLFEQRMGGVGTKTAADAMAARNAPLAQPVYSPDVAPRPNATSRTSVPPEAGPASASGTADGPDAYHGSEMGGTKWSDAYSFVGGPEGSSDKIYNPIKRNFESIVSITGIQNAPAAKPTVEKKSPKEEALLRDFEAFAAARDRDVPGPVARK